MADDPKDPSAKDDPKPDPSDDPKDLGDAGKKALEAERKARKAAEKSAKDLEERLKAIEDKDKSETQKLSDAKADAEKRAEESELRALRLEVAADKGLTTAQAKRISGKTREELEADADEFLDSIKPGEDKGKPGGGKPKEALRGGGDPTEEPDETDPRKLAAAVPRL